MADDIEFVDGLFAKEPHENAPEFVKCKLSIKRKDLGNWLRGKEDEWINLDVKESQNGKWYAEVNTWKPDQKSAQAVSTDFQAPVKDDFEDDLDIPF